MKVFIDTGAFIAYFVKQEEFHNFAIDKYHFYLKQKATLITSDYILDELITWFSAKQSRYLLEKLIVSLNTIQKTRELRVLFIDQLVFKKAQDTLLKFSEHRISFTDATTYVFYKDLQLDEVFTLDRDFKRMRVATSF